MMPLLLLGLAADLSPKNVSELKVAWTFHTQVAPVSGRAEHAAAFEATRFRNAGRPGDCASWREGSQLQPHPGSSQQRIARKILSQIRQLKPPSPFAKAKALKLGALMPEGIVPLHPRPEIGQELGHQVRES